MEKLEHIKSEECEVLFDVVGADPMQRSLELGTKILAGLFLMYFSFQELLAEFRTHKQLHS